MSLTIGVTTSLIKWVALKWALTYSAHMMLRGGGKTGKKKTMKCVETEGKMEGRWWNDSREKKNKEADRNWRSGVHREEMKNNCGDKGGKSMSHTYGTC